MRNWVTVEVGRKIAEENWGGGEDEGLWSGEEKEERD
mgnify:CR=1 FL=1